MSTAETSLKLGVKHRSKIRNKLKKIGLLYTDRDVPSAQRSFRAEECTFCPLLLQPSLPPPANNLRSEESFRLVGVLPGTGRILCGVAVLSTELFVVRNFSSVIDVYDLRIADGHKRMRKGRSSSPCRRHNIAGLRDPVDIAACPIQKALYVSGSSDRSIFRIGGSGQVLGRWLLDSRPFGVSVCRQSGTICVTFLDEAMVKEFSPDGEELRTVRLDAELLSYPWHAIVLPPNNSSGKRSVRRSTIEDEEEEREEEDGVLLLVCHGWTKDRLNSVSLVNGADGRVIGRYGGQRGSGTDCMDLPSHILLECTRSGGATQALVVDLNNSRILRLRVPQFGAGAGGGEERGGRGGRGGVGVAVSAETVLSDSSGLKWPRSLALDDGQGRLYVGLHEGQVLIFEYSNIVSGLDQLK